MPQLASSILSLHDLSAGFWDMNFLSALAHQLASVSHTLPPADGPRVRSTLLPMCCPQLCLHWEGAEQLLQRPHDLHHLTCLQKPESSPWQRWSSNMLIKTTNPSAPLSPPPPPPLTWSEIHQTKDGWLESSFDPPVPPAQHWGYKCPPPLPALYKSLGIKFSWLCHLHNLRWTP